MVLWNLDLLWKNYGTMDQTFVLWKKLWDYEKKTMMLYRHYVNFDLLWKNLWYNGKNMVL